MMRNQKSIFLFIGAILLLTLSPCFSQEASSSLRFSVQLREWFVLEVTDSVSTQKSEGPSGATVVSRVDLKGEPVQIRALVSLGKNQRVQLRVQALGDLTNSRGEILPASEIAWEGSGEGFLSGVLNKGGSQVMAQWIGSGIRQGTVLYHHLKGEKPKGDFTQTVIYSLTAT